MRIIPQRLCRLHLLFVFFFLTVTGYAQPFSFFKTGDTEDTKYPKREMRAVWLTTIGGLDWPHNYAQNGATVKKQQQELIDILDRLQRSGINTVLLQTRIRGTVIYPSLYELWDGCLSGIPGKSPGYDALQFAIDECHKRGMEIHAWVVTIPVGKWNAMGCRQLRNKYPRLIKKIGEEGYMDPENLQTSSYLADVCKEIVRNYDVDGIHLDYIRYPETWNIRVSREQGRRYITSIVEAIHRQVKMQKPWVKMSCSPIGKSDDLSRFRSNGWNAYTKVCQDAQGWLRSGLMDALFPMMYFQGNQFYPFAIDWAEQSYGRIIAPGLGIYFMSPSEKNWALDVITRELYVLRQYGTGHAYFRSKFFTDNVKGIYSFALREFTPYPALVPPMIWESKTRPTPPTKLSVQPAGNSTTLNWQGATNRSNAPYLLYNVYASKTYPVNINDARNLIATRRQDTSLQISSKNAPLYYAVTAIDRYGNESDAIQSAPPKQQIDNVRMLKCDGRRLQLPPLQQGLDADVLMIESLSGCVITTYSNASETLNVSRLANGMYILKSLNHKGVSHRLGFFMVRR